MPKQSEGAQDGLDSKAWAETKRQVDKGYREFFARRGINVDDSPAWGTARSPFRKRREG